MHLACVLLLALVQGQSGKDTKGSEPTTHDHAAATQPESRPDTPGATSSNTSDKVETLSPVHQTDLQGEAPKKTPAKSAKKAHKTTKSMPEATPPSTPGNATEGMGTPAKKAPKHKEPNMQGEEKKDSKDH
jgi:hypothetical protein